MRLLPQSCSGSIPRTIFLVGICPLTKQTVMLCLIGSVIVLSSDSFLVLWYGIVFDIYKG